MHPEITTIKHLINQIPTPIILLKHNKIIEANHAYKQQYKQPPKTIQELIPNPQKRLLYHYYTTTPQPHPQPHHTTIHTGQHVTITTTTINQYTLLAIHTTNKPTPTTKTEQYFTTNTQTYWYYENNHTTQLNNKPIPNLQLNELETINNQLINPKTKTYLNQIQLNQNLTIWEAETLTPQHTTHLEKLITGIKHTQTQHQHSLAKELKLKTYLSNLFQNSYLSFIFMNPETKTITLITEKAQEILKQAQLTTQQLLTIIQNTPNQQTIQLTTLNNHTLNITIATILDPMNKPHTIMITIQDQTQLQQAKQHQTQLEKQLQTIINQTQDIIILYNTKGQIITINNACKNLLHNLSQTTTQPHPHTIQTLLKTMNIPLQTNLTHQQTVTTTLTYHNNTIPIQVRITPIPENTHPHTILMQLTLQKQKQLTELENKIWERMIQQAPIPIQITPHNQQPINNKQEQTQNIITNQAQTNQYHIQKYTITINHQPITIQLATPQPQLTTPNTTQQQAKTIAQQIQHNQKTQLHNQLIQLQEILSATSHDIKAPIRTLQTYAKFILQDTQLTLTKQEQQQLQEIILETDNLIHEIEKYIIPLIKGILTPQTKQYTNPRELIEETLLSNKHLLQTINYEPQALTTQALTINKQITKHILSILLELKATNTTITKAYLKNNTLIIQGKYHNKPQHPTIPPIYLELASYIAKLLNYQIQVEHTKTQYKIQIKLNTKQQK